MRKSRVNIPRTPHKPPKTGHKCIHQQKASERIMIVVGSDARKVVMERVFLVARKRSEYLEYPVQQTRNLG